MVMNPQHPTSTLPADACTQEGYWSFFEAFVRSPEVRQAYTAQDIGSRIEPFRIALTDDRWVYAGPGASGRELLDVQERKEGERFKVEYVRAQFDAEDQVVSTQGTPGSYTFDFIDGCWRLTEYQH